MYEKVRKRSRKLVLDLLSLRSKPKAGIHILNGHFLSLDPRKPASIFEAQLAMLKSRGVQFIDFDLAVERIQEGEIPDDKCLAAFTFDDGFEECYSKIRPVLNMVGIKAGFFINPNFISGDSEYIRHFKHNVVLTDKEPMDWEQIRALSDEGHIIGAHTMDHLRLDISARDKLIYQIGQSRVEIEKVLGQSCKYFAFPFGRLEQISKAGIEIAKEHFEFVFSQSNYRYYYSFNGSVINRRHFECDWPYRHVLYFLKLKSMD